MSKRKGRPTRWTLERYFRLWSYVDYHHRELKLSVRRACQILSEREPWSETGLSATTLRRRFAEAQELYRQRKIGIHLPANPTLKDYAEIDLTFVLELEDIERMMGRFRYPAWYAKVEREHQELQADMWEAERRRLFDE